MLSVYSGTKLKYILMVILTTILWGIVNLFVDAKTWGG